MQATKRRSDGATKGGSPGGTALQSRVSPSPSSSKSPVASRQSPRSYPRSPDAAADLIAANIGLVYACANRAARAHGYAPEALLGPAYEFAVAAARTWDPDKGRLSTHVYACLRMKLLNYKQGDALAIGSTDRLRRTERGKGGPDARVRHVDGRSLAYTLLDDDPRDTTTHDRRAGAAAELERIYDRLIAEGADTAAQVVRHLASGATYTQIGAGLGVSRSMVWQIATNAGITLRPKAKRLHHRGAEITEQKKDSR